MVIGYDSSVRKVGSVTDADFVGRAADDAAVEALFASGARLVTIHGLGGIGKTRFVRHFAASRLETVGEVWFCDLTEAQSHSDVLAQMTALFEVSVDPALDLEDSPTPAAHRLRRWTSRIGEAIARRGRVLVVVDNFERVVDTAPATIGAWLAVAPEARFLVTSREALAIQGEQRHELLPLRDEEAVTLFAKRMSDHGGAVAESDRAVVYEIVRRLDAIPLAVELAASRAQVVGLEDLRDRLASRIAWLRSTRRDVEPRQATMTSVIDWSWELLSATEQDALAELAVFRGGFVLAAAEAMLSASHGDEVVALIERLRLKSLIRVLDGASGEGPRLGLFEVVREYALAKLSESGRRAAVEGRHAAYMLARCRTGPRDLADEIHNLTLAHAWLVIHDAPASVEVLVRLRHLLLYSGSVDVYLALIDASLAGVERAPAGDRAMAMALRLRGEVWRVRARYEDSLNDLQRALTLARAIEDRLLEAQIRCAIGIAAWQLGRDADALREGREALALAEALRAPSEEAQARNLLGTEAWMRGDAAAMVEHFERALQIQRDAGQPIDAAIVLILYVAGTHELGRIHRARELAIEALGLSRDVEDRRHEAAALSALGQIAFELGDDTQAASQCAAALALAQKVGSQRHEAMALARLGVIAFHHGELELARERFELAERLVARAADRRLGLYRGWLGAALAMLGRPDEAAERFVSARAHAERLCDPGVTAALLAMDAFRPLYVASTTTDEAERHLALAAVDAVLASRDAASASPHVGASLSVFRVLAQWRARCAVGALPAAIEPVRHELCVDEEGRWFETAEGLCDLTRRRSLRYLLRALVAQAVQNPAQGLSLDPLFAAGWPGEKANPLAAARRVYTAIGMLRDLGLRNILVRHDDGYLLDPAVVLAIERGRVRRSNDP